MSGPMTILLNGEARDIGSGSTLLDLLRTLGLDPAAVVVELNRNIVRKPAIADTPLHDGDQVELVHFVRGG